MRPARHSSVSSGVRPLEFPVLDLTTPDWGRGAAVAETLGPFTGLDGRLFWFDFFPLIRLVPIYLAGDVQPAVLFDLHPPGVRRGGRCRSPTRSHGSGSSLFNCRMGVSGSAPTSLPTAPAGTYVGLRIDKGQLTFTPPLVIVGGKLTIPAAGHCAVHLNLPAQAPFPAPAGRRGLTPKTRHSTCLRHSRLPSRPGATPSRSFPMRAGRFLTSTSSFIGARPVRAPVRADAALRGHPDVGLSAGR